MMKLSRLRIRLLLGFKSKMMNYADYLMKNITIWLNSLSSKSPIRKHRMKGSRNNYKILSNNLIIQRNSYRNSTLNTLKQIMI